MVIKNIIENFLGRYSVDKKFDKEKIAEVALNCVSLSEAWRLNSNAEGSLTISAYDDDDLLIDSMHGNSWETIPVELINICLNRADKVKTVRVFSYKNDGNEPKTVMIGCLDIS